MLNINYRKLSSSAQPLKQAHSGDACFDLTSVSHRHVSEKEVSFHEYGTGLALEIPDGYVGLVFPRSSVSNTGALMCNSVGVIDSGYRGEIKIRYKSDRAPYQPGERVGQLMILPIPKIEFKESMELNRSKRGSGGFGSTGR